MGWGAEHGSTMASDPVPAQLSALRGNIVTVSCFWYLGSYLAQDGSI